MLAKTVTLTLPAALLVVIWWKGGKLRSRDFKITAPFFLTGAALGAFATWMQTTHTGASGRLFPFTFPDRCLIAGPRALVLPRQTGMARQPDVHLPAMGNRSTFHQPNHAAGNGDRSADDSVDRSKTIRPRPLRRRPHLRRNAPPRAWLHQRLLAPLLLRRRPHAIPRLHRSPSPSSAAGQH